MEDGTTEKVLQWIMHAIVNRLSPPKTVAVGRKTSPPRFEDKHSGGIDSRGEKLRSWMSHATSFS
uniref:Uncharacterized protein n=1 Tax=Anopheles dirus TaxID=7168 RepID=A0A182NXT1_9DIPT